MLSIVDSQLSWNPSRRRLILNVKSLLENDPLLLCLPEEVGTCTGARDRALILIKLRLAAV